MIELLDLSFTYPGEAKPALRDVSLRCRPGELCWITGCLGSGCSTLLLVLAGLAPRVTGGELEGSRTFGGDDVSRPLEGGVREPGIGIVLPAPWTQLSGITRTVFQEVAFGPQNLGWPAEKVRDVTAAQLGRLGLGDVARRDPVTLSGGELARVVIAGILAMEPEVLLLDEPLLELDSANAQLVLDVISEMSHERTVVVASTDADRFAPVADRVVVLSRGQVVGDGAPAATLSSVDPMKAPLPHVARMALAAGVTGGLPFTVKELARRFREPRGGA